MLKKGVYEDLVDSKKESDMLSCSSQGLACKSEDVDSAESPKIIAEYVANVIQKKIEDIEDAESRVKFANMLLNNIKLDDELNITNPMSMLTEVMSRQQFEIQNNTRTSTVRPLSGFRVSTLFTGGSSKLSLVEEIRREIVSANEICLIVSFLRMSGVRLLLDDLKKFCEKDGNRLRIITTTYCGATEVKAIERLAELPNTEIRISYNSDIERLHAKSYIFLRDTGLNTAYIGSSNLSKSAQTDGLEWNVRVTSYENAQIIKTAIATFDMYWNSQNFEDFRVGGIDKFREELNIQKTHVDLTKIVYQKYTLLPHQKQILDKLQVVRSKNGNNRNLIVAATGTGKTVISAFDYLDFRRKNKRSRILFTAHREEILKQAIKTYRSVLEDHDFGVLWTGNCNLPQREDAYENLFVSIGMLNSRFDSEFEVLGEDYYDYIVIDEAHHSMADSYRKLFKHFKPKILVGLTATPERMDGQDLRPDFGGMISAEIRLPQALEAGLLTPFQYLCITDSVDLSDDNLWTGQKYNTERLSERLCDKERAQAIAQALNRYLADEYTCKALCFCVNKKHADFMAEQLRLNGFSAYSLTSDTPAEERVKLAKQLRDGEIHYLCVVDIFNEGVDLPEVDTVLFLRPTESLTVFLQQLGRGLRLSVGKTELTVLDFVAQANKKYDFANKFRALSLNPEKNVVNQIKNGFTFLPHGCSIIMEKKAREYILENINSAIYNRSRLIRELNSYTEFIPTLTQFLENNSQDIRVVYQTKHSWSWLKREAGRISYADDEITKRLDRGMANLIHHNTTSFIYFVRDFINGGTMYMDPEYNGYKLMLYYDLFHEKLDVDRFDTVDEALGLIHDAKYSVFKQEISEILDCLLDNVEIETKNLGEGIPNLELYGCYTREEIFTLVGKQTESRVMQGNVSGVFELRELNSLLLFVTLNKSDKDFSPTTMYNDYLINENYFHWQSQNRDSHENNGGRRYINHIENKNKVIMFVREEKKDGYGNTSPFHCFGFVDYVSSNGDYPMNVKWRLEEPAMAQYRKTI